MMRRGIFAELRERLDVRDVAEGAGLTRRRLDFDCPACSRKLRVRSNDGRGWHCVGCKSRGDAVDLLALMGGGDRAAALRAACRLAGIDLDDRSNDRPPPPPRPAPSPPPPLADDEREQRLRALRAAALHYGYLSGWWGQKDTPRPGEHLRYLADLAGFDRRQIPGILAASDAAQAYLSRRLQCVPADPLAGIVAACPTRRTGLAEYLRHLGGPELAEAGTRTGLLYADCSEALGGRLVYVWTDAAGRALTLTGRRIDGLAPDSAPKVRALPVHGAGADLAAGVPRPGVPFGLHLALAIPGPLLIVEGETAALAALRDGCAAVATGGTSRTPAHDLARALGERVTDAVVVFDCERDPAKQPTTDARAEDLARALGCSWVPSSRRGA
jgi:hypothetical protein